LDPEELERFAVVMRKHGVTRFSSRSKGAEIEIELSPTTAGVDFSGFAPPETAEAPTTKPGMCKHPGCNDAVNGFVAGYCRLHGLQAAGVNVAA